jgi:hypothetical protein
LSTSSSDLIQLRLKLVDGKYFVDGVEKGTKSVKGLGRATTETATRQKYAEKTTSRLSASYKKLGSTAKWGLGFLGVGGVLAVESSIHATEELGKATSSLSRNYGFATNVASRWAGVMAARESDPKALTQALGTLSTKMVTAGREGGKSLTAFHLLGISQEEVTRGAKDFEWGLLRVAKALGEEEGSAKRSAAAKALLGKGFQLLTPLFSEGVTGLKEQLHWADEYGVTLTTNTNEAIMEMVSSQRENKVAMLGLQLALTKALMPAIHEGDEQLQEFIATLNSPKLTAEQKINRIVHQFGALEEKIVHGIEQALPVVAEQAAHLGAMLAGAIWQGFLHSNLTGKAVIGAWIFHVFGGEGLIKAGAMKVGGMIGTSMGIGLATGAVGAFVAYELWTHLSRESKLEIKEWGEQAAADFVNYFVRKFNASMDEVNPFGNLPFGLSVDAPNIPEVEGPGPRVREIPGGSPQIVHGHPHGHPHGGGRGTPKEVREAEEKLERIEAGRGRRRSQNAQVGRARPRTELLRDLGGGSSGHRSGRGGRQPLQISVTLDRKVLGEAFTSIALDDAALA